MAKENSDQHDDEIDNMVNVHCKMPREEREITFYKISDEYRRTALIFSHDDFDYLETRIGNKEDTEALENELRNLRFDVQVYINLTWNEINTIITDIAKKNHSKTDCLVLAVLTHGNIEKLYAKDTFYSPSRLWNNFTIEKCPSLSGKPKLFFIQSCLGLKLDDGVTLSFKTDGYLGNECSKLHFPDFLIVYSTVPGYSSWKEDYGSWFIQKLCENLNQYGSEEDILKILTRVSQEVALKFESYTEHPETHGKKQVPCIISTLTRSLLFRYRHQ